MVNTVFNLIDSNGNQIYSKIYISPALTPLASGSNVVTNDSVIVTENKSSVTVSLIPSTYNVRLVGSNTKTAFIINLPQQANGTTVNASDYMVSVIPSVNYNAATASFAQFANSSSFAQTASYVSGGGTSLVTGSTYPITASVAVSASYAPQQTVTTVPSASWASQSLSASYSPKQFPNVYDSGSKVGINKPNPQYTLDVAGDINFAGGLRQNGLIYINDLAPNSSDTQILFNSNGVISGDADLTFNSAFDQLTIGSTNAGFASIYIGQVQLGNGLDSNLHGLVSNTNDTPIAVVNANTGKFFYGTGDGSTGLTLDLNNFGYAGILNASPIFPLDVNGIIGNSATSITEIGASDNVIFKVTDAAHTPYLDIDINNIRIGLGTPANPAYDITFGLNGTEYGYFKSGGHLTCSVITASGVVATNLQQLPYSSSAHPLSPTVNTGSMYFRVSGSTNFMFVYNGTKWVSSSMA